MKFAAVLFLLIGVLAFQGKTTWDGVYSDAQAKRGEAVYTKTCSGCHGNDLMGGDAPSLTGSEFNVGWNDQTADDLSERIRISMPADSPGSLNRETVADIVAFIFAKDKFPAGSSDLPATSDLLKQIKILAQKP